MLTIWEGVVLGVIQGIAEWLPISSEAMITLFAINLLGIEPTVALNLALILHVGTVLSAIMYFWSVIIDLLKNRAEHYREWRFLIVATIISVLLGGVIYLGLSKVAVSPAAGSILTIGMGIALLVTAFLLSRSIAGQKDFSEVSLNDSVILGITQGLAVIPGISRSGTTTALALWRGFSSESALVVSFIMGIPMILIGATLLVLQGEINAVIVSVPGLVALVVTTITGFLTIKLFMKMARSLDFSKFVFLIGILAIVAGITSF